MQTDICPQCNGRNNIHSTLCQLSTLLTTPSTETIGIGPRTNPTTGTPAVVIQQPQMPSPQLFLAAVVWGYLDGFVNLKDEELAKVSERLEKGELVPDLEFDVKRKTWVITVREGEGNAVSTES